MKRARLQWGVTEKPHPPDDAEAEEREFLRTYNPGAFPPIGVTVDVVVLTVQQDQLSVLLIRRGGHPHRGRWALPGGFVMPDEDLDVAAARELAEETGVPLDRTYLEQLRSYGRPGRDPRMRIVSVAYLGLVPELPRLSAGSDATDTRLWPLADLATGGSAASDVSAACGERPRLAFDHEQILGDAVERARAKLEYTSLATVLVPDPFTVTDLHRVYEAVWCAPLDPERFRDQVLSVPGYVTPVAGSDPAGGTGEVLYTRGAATVLHPAILRPIR